MKEFSVVGVYLFVVTVLPAILGWAIVKFFMNAKAEDDLKERQEQFFMLNPEYENATHAVWFCGLESFEAFCQREFPGQKIPLPSFR
jgi:hypothetical protein